MNLGGISAWFRRLFGGGPVEPTPAPAVAGGAPAPAMPPPDAPPEEPSRGMRNALAAWASGLEDLPKIDLPPLLDEPEALPVDSLGDIGPVGDDAGGEVQTVATVYVGRGVQVAVPPPSAAAAAAAAPPVPSVALPPLEPAAIPVDADLISVDGADEAVLAVEAPSDEAPSEHPSSEPTASPPLPSETAATPATASPGLDLLRAFVREVAERAWKPWFEEAATDLPSASAILWADGPVRVAALFWAYDLLVDGGLLEREDGDPERTAIEQIVGRLARFRLPYEAADLAAITRSIARVPPGKAQSLETARIVGHAERLAQSGGLDEGLRHALGALRTWAAGDGEHGPEGIVERLDAILGERKEEPLIPPGAWGDSVMSWIGELDVAERGPWTALLAHVVEAVGRNQPTRAWERVAAQLVDAVGRDNFTRRVVTWLDELDPGPDMGEPTEERLKGLIWATGSLHDASLADEIGRFARTCFRRGPGGGARSLVLGKAAVHSLCLMPDDVSFRHLSPILRGVRQKTVRKVIERALEEIAERLGMTPEDLDELAVPNFGMGLDGTRREPVGDCEAVVRIVGSDEADLVWVRPGGREQKSPPKQLLPEHADDVDRFRQLAAEVQAVLAERLPRIERHLISERSWTLADWRARYGDHPVLATICRRLIWHFQAADRSASGLWGDAGAIDAAGAPLDWIGEGTRVRLWHPLAEKAESIRAWQTHVESKGPVQPFHQAHREVYLLSDADKKDGLATERFAGHAVPRRSLVAATRQRGWEFEDGEAPRVSLTLLRRLLRIELAIVPLAQTAAPGDDGEEEDAMLVTGAVRFADMSGQPVRLEFVPRVVFSEAMRDLDLAIAASAVCTSPDAERPTGGPALECWTTHGLGDLATSARTRRHVLTRLAGRWPEAERVAVGDRFAVVKGDLATYRVHLGSMRVVLEGGVREGADDTLIRVPASALPADRAAEFPLPFEGDERLRDLIALVLALASDSAIDDAAFRAAVGAAPTTS